MLNGGEGLKLLKKKKRHMIFEGSLIIILQIILFTW